MLPEGNLDSQSSKLPYSDLCTNIVATEYTGSHPIENFRKKDAVMHI